ncbi:hypothetical protein EJD97_007654 [Solanum chilense]|uniref:Uncharacterized protein n=1 Tax=Solanum chilense TaxID=4083 RepID=A0A6N2CA01_SOLCI|nr:hypothetical protein EJD97_007654 [Solanum chilense]
MDILPLQDQYMTPPTAEPRDNIQQGQPPLNDPDEDEETNEALIKTVSPPNDQALEEEIQQVTQSQCLSPREFQHEKCNFKKQDVNIFTTGRPNTRVFSSRSSQ